MPQPKPCSLCHKQPRSMEFVYEAAVCSRCARRFAIRRMLAYLIDYLFILGVASILVLICQKIGMGSMRSQFGSVDEIVLVMFLADLLKYPMLILMMIDSPDLVSEPAATFFWAGRFVLLPLIFTLRDGIGGVSFGKAICGLQVIDQTTHQPIGFLQSFQRNIQLALPLVWMFVGMTLYKGTRLGDTQANTRVILRAKRLHPIFSGLPICEKCNYNLTGNTTGVCPECGITITGLPKDLIRDEALHL